MALSNNEVAHQWAQRRVDSKKGSNFFYEGDALYSYGKHFMVARHIDAPNGAPFVVFNSERYSTSTSRHQSIARRAVIGRIFIDADPSQNVDQWVAELKEQCVKARTKFNRARTNKSWYAVQFARYARQLSFLNTAYALEIDVPSFDDMDKMIEQAREAEEAAARKRDLENAEKVEAWKAGKRAQCPHTSTIYLRVVDDTIETSWGARVPVSVAPGLWEMVKHSRAHGVGSVFEQKTMFVGWYPFKHVTTKGDLVIGCHTISFSELRRIAAILNYELE